MIPDGNKVKHGARLSFFLQHTVTEVWLEDQLRLSTMEPDAFHIGKTPGKGWITVPIHPDQSGKMLTIILTPVYKSIKWEDPQFLLIEHGDLLNLIVEREDRPWIIAAVFTLIPGGFLAVISLFMKIDKRDKKRLFYLGAIAFCVGLWKMMDLPVTALFLDVYGLQKEIWFLETCAFLMLPLLVMQFTETYLGRKWGSLLTEEFLFAVLPLQLLNIADFYVTKLWYGLLCVIIQFAAVFTATPSRRDLLWLLFFPFTGLLDLSICFLTGSDRWAVFSLCWVLCNLIFRGAGFVNDAVRREHRLYEARTELQEERVRGMIQQIRPHFLYNTLTSVYVLCREDPPRAMEVVQNFTDYLQANFNAIGASELISFSDELRHTKAYLAVESIRFEDKLTVDYDIQHSAFRLPPLTLQPLVENAVKYGVGKGNFPEHILIHTHMENDSIVLTVTDDGPGFAADVSAEEAHVGIRNVRNRLELMCGGMLEIQSKPNDGTTVTVILPVITGKTDHKPELNEVSGNYK